MTGIRFRLARFAPLRKRISSKWSGTLGFVVANQNLLGLFNGGSNSRDDPGEKSFVDYEHASYYIGELNSLAPLIR